MMPADFHLVTLGRIALEPPPGADDAGLNRQRRKLAVLALLALSRSPVSRDLLLEMFWGEQNESRARHSLSDALSHLRRVLGPGAIPARHAEVLLSGDAPLRLDVTELEEAVGNEDYARVLELYAGPFLSAVYVGASPRFEQWVEREGRRIERLFLTACERRCADLEDAGSWPELERVARRWTEADPLSTNATLALLSAIRGEGSREAELRAVEEYELHRARLAREFGVEPDPGVSALAESLRGRIGRARGPLREAADPGPPEDALGSPEVLRPDPGEGEHEARAEPGVALPFDHERPSARTPMAVAQDSAAPAGPEHARPGQGAGPKRWAAAVLGMAAVAAIALMLVLFAPPLRTTPAGSTASVAIFPFTIHGDEEFGYLREGMVDLLSTNLDGTAGLRTVDPRAVLAATEVADPPGVTPERGRELAARLGAAIYVMGDVVEAGGRLRVSAALYDVAEGEEPLTRAYAEGESDSLFALVDQLTVELLSNRFERVGGRLARIAALTTASIPALKSYLEGERHWRALRLVDAVDALHRATRQDSTFALAWYRLGMASSWDARVDVAEEAMDRAVRHSGALSERDRALIAAYRDIVYRNTDRAERRYRAVLSDYPSDVEAWAGLGEILFHSNPSRGRSFEESRPAWEQVLRLEPRNVGATWHLAYVAARQGRKQEVDSLTRRIHASVAGGVDLSLRAIRAVTLEEAEDREALLAELAEADDFTVILAVWRVAVSTEDLAAVTRFAELLGQPRRPQEVRALGHVLRAHLRLAQGQWRRAGAELDTLERLDPNAALEYRALFDVFPFERAPRSGAAGVTAALRRPASIGTRTVTGPAGVWLNAHADLHPQLRLYLLGLTSARAGDREEAERAAVMLAQAARDADAGNLALALAREIRAEILRQSGQGLGALALLEAGHDVVDFGSARVSPFYARSRQRFLRGELLREAGREAEALGWYRGIGQIYPFDVIYLAPAHLRQAEIHAGRGEHRAAAEHFQRFLSLWRDCDAELRPWVEQARRSLAALPE